MPGDCDVNAETVAHNMGFCVEYAITCPRDPQKLYRKDQAHAVSKIVGPLVSSQGKFDTVDAETDKVHR